MVGEVSAAVTEQRRFSVSDCSDTLPASDMGMTFSAPEDNGR